jgi:hypothetical protein
MALCHDVDVKEFLKQLEVFVKFPVGFNKSDGEEFHLSVL